jgi:hypothetical protein
MESGVLAQAAAGWGAGEWLLLSAALFAVAALYASVGHGGASGYLAVLGWLALWSPAEMSGAALVMNCLVAGLGFRAFRRAGWFEPRLLWPFLLGSAPAAFVGGMLTPSVRLYMLALGAALAFAALRLAWRGSAAGEEPPARRPHAALALAAGAALGLMSGMVGVGGGIFLSPLMMLAGWAGPKRTAAVSAGFIVVNSLAGLGGRLASGAFAAGPLTFMVLPAMAGGALGASWGAEKFGGLALRRLLALVLLAAAVKMLARGWAG